MSVAFATVDLGGPALAVLADGYLLPVAALGDAASRAGLALPQREAARSLTLKDVLASWDRWCDAARAAAEGGLDDRWIAAGDVAFAAAVPEPPDIYCAGANYYDHAAEMGHERPSKDELAPYHFLASKGALTGHRCRVRRPDGCEHLDWEVELAVVIGRTARNVPAAQAGRVIAGYTVANDLSARDLAPRSDVPFHPDWLRSKCYEGFLPVGPAVVPAAAVPDPMALELLLSVNGEVMQRSNTSEMIFSVFEQIEYLSRIAPLSPGDLVLTGTPAGTGTAWGRYLEPGDRIEATIASIGTLETVIVDGDHAARPGAGEPS